VPSVAFLATVFQARNLAQAKKTETNFHFMQKIFHYYHKWLKKEALSQEIMH